MYTLLRRVLSFFFFFFLIGSLQFSFFGVFWSLCLCNFLSRAFCPAHWTDFDRQYHRHYHWSYYYFMSTFFKLSFFNVLECFLTYFHFCIREKQLQQTRILSYKGFHVMGAANTHFSFTCDFLMHLAEVLMLNLTKRLTEYILMSNIRSAAKAVTRWNI